MTPHAVLQLHGRWSPIAPMKDGARVVAKNKNSNGGARSLAASATGMCFGRIDLCSSDRGHLFDIQALSLRSISPPRPRHMHHDANF